MSLNDMKRKWIAATIMSVFLISLVLVMVSQHTTPHERLPTNISPILIDAESDFDAEHGVVRGSGIISDPYVIEGWQIDVSRDCPERSCTGIVVQNANASFVIRNVIIRGGIYDNGIRFSGVKNARLESVLVESGGDGISVVASINVTLFRNVVVGDDRGIFVTQSHDVWVCASSISLGVQGIVVEDASRISLLDNILTGNKANGVLFLHVTNSTLEGNTITETSFRGIALFNSSDIVASRNRIVGSGEECLYVASGGRTSMIQNEVSNCEWAGVSVYKSDENLVKDNLVARTPSGVLFSDSSRNVAAFNSVTDTGWGITIASDSDANYIVENTVSLSAHVGILLIRFDDHTPDRNIIQGNTVSQSGDADLLDSSGGTDNLWRFNAYEKEIPSTSD